MKTTYSLYEAKAKLSELVRQVREGKTVTITYRGEPVVEMRQPEPPPDTLDARLKYLEETGQLIPARGPMPTTWKPIAVVPGALERFLADRNRF